MTTLSPPRLPLQALQAGFRRFTVKEYHDLIRVGVITEDDDLELIEGYLVHKVSRNPPHDSTILRLNNRLVPLLPAGWVVRIQSGITLGDSEPEPDVAVVRGNDRTFDARHPGAADFGVVMEVSDWSLAGDRDDKARMYARAAIPEYWIINLVDRQIEVYTAPTSAGGTPAYTTRKDYGPTDSVPLALSGVTVAALAVADLLP